MGKSELVGWLLTEDGYRAAGFANASVAVANQMVFLNGPLIHASILGAGQLFLLLDSNNADWTLALTMSQGKHGIALHCLE